MEKLLTLLYVSVMVLFDWLPLKCNCDITDSNLVTICTRASPRQQDLKLCARLDNDDSLSIVDLRHHSLDTIPLRFFERRDTEVLDLGDNKLTHLPDELEKLTNLEYLNLMGNRISDIVQESVINKLPSLEFLVLSKNPLTTLKGLRIGSLVILEADHCEIKEIDDYILTSLPSLRSLNLTGNPLRSVHKLMNMNLTELLLADCKLTELPSNAFHGLPNLQSLDLRGNKLKTLPDQIFLHNNNLIFLSLRKNILQEIKYTWFEQMLTLRKLDLSENEITFVNETIFAKLSSLSELHLGCNRVAALPNLKTRATNVNLSKNSLGNQRLWDLTSMSNVRKLDLSRNRFYGDCDEFKSMSLRILDLGYNNMTRVRRNSFSDVPNLMDLSLKGNKFSHGADLTFEDNKILVDVDLEDNPWHCNCSDLYPLYTYLEHGQKEDTESLICWTPDYAKGESWWSACSDDWKSAIKSNEVSTTDVSKTWLIVTSAIFSICLLLGTLIYIIYTSKRVSGAQNV